MSTTYRAILILGCKAEFVRVTRQEARFDPKTGQPVDPASVFDHWDLKVGEKTLWSGVEQWQADDALEVMQNLKIERIDEREVIVGKLLGKVDGVINFQEVLPSTSMGDVSELLGVLGTVPTLFLIQTYF